MTTNTFGANRLKFDKDVVKGHCRGGCCQCKKVDEAGRGYVALDLGPLQESF